MGIVVIVEVAVVAEVEETQYIFIKKNSNCYAGQLIIKIDYSYIGTGGSRGNIGSDSVVIIVGMVADGAYH